MRSSILTAFLGCDATKTKTTTLQIIVYILVDPIYDNKSNKLLRHDMPHPGPEL